MGASAVSATAGATMLGPDTITDWLIGAALVCGWVAMYVTTF